MTADEAKAFLALGIHRDHRMKKDAPANPFADRAKPAIPAFAGLEVDLAGVLDRKNMSARRGNNRAFAPPRHQSLHSHSGIGEKPVKPHFRTALTRRQATDANATGMHNPLEERRPPLSRRRSSN